MLLALVLVAAGVAAAAALSASRSTASPGASVPKLQQRTLVKYIATGSELVLPQSATSGGVHSFGGSLAADAAGNVYASLDTFSSIDRVVVFGPDGRYLRDWPTTVGNNEPLLAVGPDGLVYVANDITGRVSVHRPDGPLVRQLGGGLPVAGVMDLEVDAAGSVYLSRGNGPDGDDIVRYNAAGTVTGRFVPFPRATFGSPSGNYLRGLAVAPDGSIYVTTTSSAPKGRRYLIRLDASGKELKTLDIEFIFGGASYEDVELVNGRLYLVGDVGHNYRISDHRRDALVVLSLEGEVIDQIAGRGTAVAVHGEDVYVTGLKKRAGARALAQSEFSIGRLTGQEVFFPTPGRTSWAHSPCGGNSTYDVSVVELVILGRPAPGCITSFINQGDPCDRGDEATPLTAYHGGERLGSFERGRASEPEPGPLVYGRAEGGFPAYAIIKLPGNSTTSGNIVVRWSCLNKATNKLEERYEWKGRIDVIDPSGNILDRKTGRPVEAATVRLQFSLRQSGPFGTPGLSGFVPQVNPQLTGRTGFFGWDVAEGFWRLRVSAFGYRAFTSPVYKVPPERKGLKLALLQNPAQQRLLIDPSAGRVGAVRIGSRAGRPVAGLRLRVAAGKVRGISVRAKKFRTVHGVGLGSRDTDLFAALPATLRARLTQKRKAVMTYRAAKATFTVKSGRVVAITLGR